MTMTRAHILPVLTLAGVLAGGSLALAQNNPPHTLQVTGEFNGSPVLRST